MSKRLFLLDGMALVYRAHFALIARPILTSKGVNTSALYGFTQTVLEIINKQKPTHLAVVFDTDAPTQRHKDFAEYKATRQVMPEDLSRALPHVRRMLEALRIPMISCDGFEADDLIGTLACRADKEGFECFMVTPDKDFGQLVSDRIRIYKPGRMGDSVEIMGPDEIRQRWGIQRAEQVSDILALMGDSSDNIPGVPGIGEKTAIKLISQFGTVEELLARLPELRGRVRDSLEENREQALLSKRLAVICCNAPCAVELESLRAQPADEGALKQLLVEFEFNSIGRRLFGEGFRAGRGYEPLSKSGGQRGEDTAPYQGVLVAESEGESQAETKRLVTLAHVSHDIQIVRTRAESEALVARLLGSKLFGLHALAEGEDVKQARLLGLAFAFSSADMGNSTPAANSPPSIKGDFVPMPSDTAEVRRLLHEFKPVLESESEKVGHDLKSTLSVLKWHGATLHGRLFDTLIAHSLVEPDRRHSLEFISESLLGYTPIVKPASAPKTDVAEAVAAPPATLVSAATLETSSSETKIAEIAVEHASLALHLKLLLAPMVRELNQERVFEGVEMPLMPALAEMEFEGIAVDRAALEDFGRQLAKQIVELESRICRAAGTTFNLNSPKQLGQILFDVMKICEAPKKTRTGQYATDEQTLMALTPDHEIVRLLLEHRGASKLKSTYADALPAAIWPATGRIHTTYHQAATATGRLNSQDPNLQNIPIRTERGQEIRRAFIPRNAGYSLLSADYSQIELRIIAALSREAGLLEAFRIGADVHTATAARVYGVSFDGVTPEMRRKAKMVNYGIAYGISAFGLAQRLGIARKEAAEIIDQYFRQFSGIRKYMDDTISFARAHGYVQTVIGRRRYLRDITSANNTVRSAAERNAINAPIQGTAADMIKIAMVNIHRELQARGLRTRMLLQVHDELVFDLHRSEEAEVRQLVEEKMKTAIPLDVPIAVEIGIGENWLEAH